MGKLPLKIEILVYLVDTKKEVTVDQVYEAMKEKYGSEGRLLTKKRVQSYLMAMLNVKMVEASNIRMENDDVVMDYKIVQPGIIRYEWIKDLIDKRLGNRSCYSVS